MTAGVSKKAFTNTCVVALALCFLAPARLASAQPDPYTQPAESPWQWYLPAIGYQVEILPEPKANAPVVVAVIDTGLDYYHPDIDPARIWRNSDETINGVDDDDNGYVDDMIGWNFIDNDNTPWDYAGHGTHVAGLIGAATHNGEGIAGINPSAQIMPLKALNFVGRGRSTGIARAVYYAVNNGAAIINLSLGGESLSEVERMALTWARKQGVLTVVAAGNSGVNSDGFGPAGLEEVLTVGAVDSELNHASFSNWGQSVDVVAPGVDILSLRARYSDFALVAGQVDYLAGQGFVGPENRYYMATGTSFAAPIVTAVASLLIQQDPTRTPEELINLLKQTATDVANPGVDMLTGYGLINVKAALDGDVGLLEAAISNVGLANNSKGKPVIQMTGTAFADELKGYRIEIGEGEDPAKWKKQGSTVKQSVRDGILAELPIDSIRKAKVWTLRLIVEHRDGRSREVRFVLRLG